jgi:hypothetical protein
MQLRTVRIILVVLTMSCWFSLGQTQSKPRSGIEGVITTGPIHPGPAREGMPSSKALGNATFIVQNKEGVVTSFTTDEKGHFRSSLDAGYYTVSIKDKKGGIGRYGPFDVDVVAGQITKVEWQCDTGMR